MVLSWASFVAPTRAVWRAAGGPVAAEDLYVREADENTMDSYVQATLGGFIYLDRTGGSGTSFTGVDGVTTPTVRNNFGTRYAGEVWADKSVFAYHQPYIAPIRPFEEGKSYDSDRLAKLQSAGVTLPAGVAAGKALTDEQADAMNNAVNALMDRYIEEYRANGITSYKFAGDGDWNGEALTLERHTDGVNSSVSIQEDADFLHVYSALGSSSQNIDGGPLDVMFALDCSRSMGNADDPTSRMAQAISALNESISTLMSLHPANRVGVVVYASRAKVLMELGHYEPMTTEGEKNIYITVSGYPVNESAQRPVTKYTITATQTTVSSGSRAPIVVTASGNDFLTDMDTYPTCGWFGEDGWDDIGIGTSIDVGVWLAMSRLAARNEADMILEINGVKVVRTPSVVLIGDGAASYLAVENMTMRQSAERDFAAWNGGEYTQLESGVALHGYGNGEWWTLGDLEHVNYALHGIGNDRPETNETLVLGTVLRLAMMKAAVNKHYQSVARKYSASNADAVKVGFYTVGVGIGTAGNAATAIFDPGNATTGFNGNNANAQVKAAYNDWLALSRSGGETVSTAINSHTWGVTSSTNANCRWFSQRSAAGGAQYRQVLFNPFTGNTFTFGANQINVTAAEFNTIMNTGYTDQYFSVTNASQLGETLGQVMTRIAVEPYKPVAGTNASGVGNAITYTDPIGKYMSVTGVTDVTMFGEQYKVGKRAVYDYAVNEEILEQLGEDPAYPGQEFIRSGWYSETVDADGKIQYKLEDGGVGAANWDKGWTYRVTYRVAQQYVPTLAEDNRASRKDLTDKQKNTTYTLYSIVEQYQRDASWNVNKSLPTTKIPSGNSPAEVAGRTRPNLSYGNNNEVTFDLLEDIKIWVEDTGDWVDTSKNEFLVDTGFSEALYINVSTDAMPVQVATVYRDTLDNGGTKPTKYETNLNDTYASTPLRIYYDVSLKKDYLRYDENGNPVGVALLAMSPEYLSQNTGTGFIINGRKSDNRYTTLYPNYYSADNYNEYPVTLDSTEVSRGNTAVTFSPGNGNQFYRFQKNRVLFLIPGSYDLDARPAEIDLGDITKLYVDGNGNISATEQSGYEPADPNDFHDLLAVLNNARLTSGEGGAPSPYWWFGDCVAVDGGDDTDNVDATFAARKAAMAGRGFDAEIALAEARMQTFKDNLGGLPYQPQVDSDNWYYIIREFYYPIFESSQSGATDQVEVHYMAIARKGSEFGSGLANGGDMGAMIEWYNAEDGRTSRFTSSKDTHFGYPGEDDDIETLPGGGHTHTGSWYISAKPGGLRVGGMANFVGTKGYDIRQGANRLNFTKDPGVIAKSNVSQRALTYFLPAVSGITETAQGGVDAVINLYLGNNGRIAVEDSVLLVTMTTNNVIGSVGERENNESFEVTVQIQNFYGIRSASLINRDEFDSSLWRRRFASIDVHTDNRDLLLSEDNELAIVDKDGRRVLAVESRVKTLDDEEGVSLGIDVGTLLSQRGSQGNGGISTMAASTPTAGNGRAVTTVEYYYADQYNEDGSLRRDADGNIVYDPERPIDPTKTQLYYVYVGKNVTKEYGTQVLRVFEADVTRNADGTIATSNLYGNLTKRGGRVFYVADDDPRVMEDADERDDPNTQIIYTKTSDQRVTSTNVHHVGDREYWIDKVYLIPVDKVDSTWSWPSDNVHLENDDSIAEGAIKFTKFVVAALRVGKDGGNTSSTELQSDRGLKIRSTILTNPVTFEAKKVGDSYAYGEAKVYLRDGEGLLFNNIGHGAWYTTTEDLKLDQANRGIFFQEVSHVQELNSRTTYAYSTSEDQDIGVADKIDGAITQPNGSKVIVKNCYYIIGDEHKDPNTGQYVYDEYDDPETGRHYYVTAEGDREPGHERHNTANFVGVNSQNGVGPYSIVGRTSLEEQAVHYVNFVPDIEKVELSPGDGRDVYLGDELSYAIRWENFDYSVQSGSYTQSPVTITDMLDQGVDFISANFNPYRGNIYAASQFNLSDYLDNEGLDAYDAYDLALTATDVATGKTAVTQHYTPGVGDNFTPFDVTLSYDSDNHTLKWDINQAPPGTYGYVELITRVNPDATGGWQYNVEGDLDVGSPVARKDNVVVNRAGITVNGYQKQVTDIVRNPTNTLSKTVDVGDGTKVDEGQTLTYTIHWSNYREEPSDITVEDRLDPGVTFKDAQIVQDDWTGYSDGEVDTSGVSHDVTLATDEPITIAQTVWGTMPVVAVAPLYQTGADPERESDEPWDENVQPLGAGNADVDTAAIANEGAVPLAGETVLTESGTVLLWNHTDPPAKVDATLSYDKDTRMLRWKLTNVPSLYGGQVTLRVVVNEDADYRWAPDDTWDATLTTVDRSEQDYTVYDRSRVKVSSDDWQETNTVVNPTRPSIIAPATGGAGIASLHWAGLLLLTLGWGLAWLRSMGGRILIPPRASPKRAAHAPYSAGPPGPPPEAPVSRERGRRL